MGQEFKKCERCSTSKVQVFHTADGSQPHTAYRILDSEGRPGLLVVGEPPAHLLADSLSPFPTNILGLIGLALLAGGSRPDAASMARAMAERAGDTAPPVKLHEGGLTGARPNDRYNASGKEPMPEAVKPANEPKVPAKPLKSLGLHICEDGGVVVTEWPEGAHPLTAVFASESPGHAVGYALQALQTARQEQRAARLGKEEADARAAHPVFIVGVDLAGGPDESGFGIRP